MTEQEAPPPWAGLRVQDDVGLYVPAVGASTAVLPSIPYRSKAAKSTVPVGVPSPVEVIVYLHCIHEPSAIFAPSVVEDSLTN